MAGVVALVLLMPSAAPAAPSAAVQPAGLVALSGGHTTLLARAASRCSEWQTTVSRLRAAIAQVKRQLETASGDRERRLRKRLRWLRNQLEGALLNKRRYC